MLSGQGDNESAFDGSATDVTVEYLTIEDFVPPGDQGVVDHGSASDWTVAYDSIEYNAPGSAVMIGSHDTVTDNCLAWNGQYGFSAYVSSSSTSASSLTGGPSDITLTDNEISYNNTCNWDALSPDPVPSADQPSNCAGAGEESGCGCSGGGKFWRTDGADVADNYVHDNFGVGLWVDTNNTGFNISGNSFAGNWGEGLMYEVSYNAEITGNTFTDNAWGEGPDSTGTPTGAIYISESGGDSAVPGFSSGSLTISGNTFTNNWSGVVLWENSNRYCSDGSDPVCTLEDPSLFTITSCGDNLASAVANETTGSPPADYYDGCRWKTENVSVTNNVFSFDESAVPSCKGDSNGCGMNALFSNYGSDAPYKGYTIPLEICNDRDNVFSDNTYVGDWTFNAFNNVKVSWSEWSDGFKNAGYSIDPQDAGSTYSS